jgi:hypothetical protein
MIKNKKISQSLSYFAYGLQSDTFPKWINVEHRGLRWKTPILNPKVIKQIMHSLKKEQEDYLSTLPIEILIDRLNQVALNWLKPKDPVREKALQILPQTTGCSRQIIEEGLNLAFREVQFRYLKACIKDLQHLPKPKLSCFIFAGLIPTPMLFDIFMGLLLKSSVIAKSPSREPFFPILLAKSIHAVDPRLASCIATFWWPGGEWEIEKTIFKEADLIHIYGNNETIKKIKSQMPLGKPFLPFGHKASFSLIGKNEHLRGKAKTLARRVAYDVSLYDQQGCVSPHVIYLEKGTFQPGEWAKELALAMEKISIKFPPAQISLGEASKIHQIRGQYHFSKKAFCLSSHPKPDWTVIYEESSEFLPSCLNRVVFVKPLNKINLLLKILGKWKGSFQAMGYSLSSSPTMELQKIVKKLKIPFLLPIGKMQATSFKTHIEERLSILHNKKMRWEKT